MSASGWAPVIAAKLRYQLRTIEAVQLDPLRTAGALLLGKEWQEWVAKVQLVAAEVARISIGARPRLRTRNPSRSMLERSAQ